MMGCYTAGMVEEWGEIVLIGSFIENLILWLMMLYWDLSAAYLNLCIPS